LNSERVNLTQKSSAKARPPFGIATESKKLASATDPHSIVFMIATLGLSILAPRILRSENY
jgi:hypothetical protein